jgi:hypothetical protein
VITEIERLLDNYRAWLHDRTVLRQVDEWVEITTPYLDRHNDYVQMYARKDGGEFLLTDDGNTITDLELSGCRLESPKRQHLLKMTLNGFGVALRNKALEVRASSDNFAARKHNLLQAILAVNDMFYLAVPLVAGIFMEDVAEWLDLHDIRYIPNVKFTGKTGFDHLFDFVIPKSRREPERILKTINRPTRDMVEALAFSWVDTREARTTDSRAYAFLNDSEQSIPVGVPEALRSYDIVPVPWSLREEYREGLAA